MFGGSVCAGQSRSASVELLSGKTRKCMVGLHHSRRSAPTMQDSTKANSEQRHPSIQFCLRPILLPTKYWRCTDELTPVTAYAGGNFGLNLTVSRPDCQSSA